MTDTWDMTFAMTRDKPCRVCPSSAGNVRGTEVHGTFVTRIVCFDQVSPVALFRTDLGAMLATKSVKSRTPHMYAAFFKPLRPSTVLRTRADWEFSDRGNETLVKSILLRRAMLGSEALHSRGMASITIDLNCTCSPLCSFSSFWTSRQYFRKAPVIAAMTMSFKVQPWFSLAFLMSDRGTMGKRVSCRFPEKGRKGLLFCSGSLMLSSVSWPTRPIRKKPRKKEPMPLKAPQRHAKGLHRLFRTRGVLGLSGDSPGGGLANSGSITLGRGTVARGFPPGTPSKGDIANSIPKPSPRE
mmetsp:Transcript_69412/g.165394  ORF Transcript_69412/g.165394 Transcript_69412/m.165394 type:complete len:298 (-) Transcript_69412:445-1338(-)